MKKYKLTACFAIVLTLAFNIFSCKTPEQPVDFIAPSADTADETDAEMTLISQNSNGTAEIYDSGIDFYVSIQPLQYNENPFYDNVTAIIHSVEELKSLCKDETYAYTTMTGTGIGMYLSDLSQTYNDEYFKDNALVAVSFEYSSMSIPKAIDNVTIQYGSLTAWSHSFEDMGLPENEKFTSGLHTARVFLIEVKKSDIEGVIEVYPGIDGAPVVIYLSAQEALNALEASIQYQNGELRFKIPAGYPSSSDWIIWISGHMTFDDGFSMTWHSKEFDDASSDRTWEAGKRYAITDTASFDGLNMDAYLPDENGELIELSIDLMPYLLPEAYPKNYVIVEFPVSTGEKWQLLLSQPVRRGDSGIWCVEQCKDENNGSLYPVTPNNGNGNPILEYYTELQKQCDNGHKPSLLDPLQAAMECITDVLGFKIALDDLVPVYSVTVEDFFN